MFGFRFVAFLWGLQWEHVCSCFLAVCFGCASCSSLLMMAQTHCCSLICFVFVWLVAAEGVVYGVVYGRPPRPKRIVTKQHIYFIYLFFQFKNANDAAGRGQHHSTWWLTADMFRQAFPWNAAFDHAGRGREQKLVWGWGGSKIVSAPLCLKNVTYIFDVIPQEITHEASKM